MKFELSDTAAPACPTGCLSIDLRGMLREGDEIRDCIDAPSYLPRGSVSVTVYHFTDGSQAGYRSSTIARERIFQ